MSYSQTFSLIRTILQKLIKCNYTVNKKIVAISPNSCLFIVAEIFVLFYNNYAIYNTFLSKLWINIS